MSEAWRILGRHKGVILLAALLGAMAAYLVTLPQTPVYRAWSFLEIQNLNEDFLNARAISPTSSPNYQSPDYNIRTQMTILQSRPVIERAINSLSAEEQKLLVPRKPENHRFKWRKALGLAEAAPPPAQDQALQEATNDLKVQSEPSTRVVKITFDAADPKLAADFVNRVADSFIQLSLDTRWQTSQNTVNWLMGRMQDVKAKLKRSEEELQRFTEAADLTFVTDKENAADERVRQMQSDLSKAQTDAAAKQARYELATTAPAESLPEVLDDGALKDYQKELTTLGGSWRNFYPPIRRKTRRSRRCACRSPRLNPRSKAKGRTSFPAFATNLSRPAGWKACCRPNTPRNAGS